MTPYVAGHLLQLSHERVCERKGQKLSRTTSHLEPVDIAAAFARICVSYHANDTLLAFAACIHSALAFFSLRETSLVNGHSVVDGGIDQHRPISIGASKASKASKYPALKLLW